MTTTIASRATDVAPLTRRLHRIEGQVRGIARMIDEDRECIDTLTQISAVTKALQNVAVELLDGHMRCSVAAITGDLDSGSSERITEATRAIERLLRV